jgi:hypothetical protein
MNWCRETALGFKISDLETGNPPEGWESEGQFRIFERRLKTCINCNPKSAFRHPNVVTVRRRRIHGTSGLGNGIKGGAREAAEGYLRKKPSPSGTRKVRALCNRLRRPIHRKFGGNALAFISENVLFHKAAFLGLCS